ncbi:MAG: glutaminyl-peptide cyclotransferase [Bacteroidales bacterium]|nr:glutaminyl-peptide cyclotransferase [Bacteroidales bacterium]
MKSFPLPGKFCTGMAFDGHHLWIADYKTDLIYKLDPESGNILYQIPSPGFWPMGLAWDGENLWNVDKQQKKIFKIDSQDGTVLLTIDAPGSQPEGLTWDGTTLWVGDAGNQTIMKIDLSDGTAVKKLDAPARSVNGLTTDGQYLWSSDRYLNEIYMIDPKSGEVIMIVDAPGPYPRGLAWDGKYLWNVDYQTDSVYQIVRQDEETFRLKETRKAQITFTHQAKVYGKGVLKNLDVFIAKPENMPQQKILDISFSPQDHILKKDRWHQQIAFFNYQNIQPNETVESMMMIQAEVSAVRYFIYPDKICPLESVPAEISQLFTANGSKYMTDDPYIQNLVKEIVGDEKNPYWIARKIFNYVRNNLEYLMEGGWNVAPVVLQRGTGSCSEYTFSFISLCRAAGLPARYVGSLVVRGDDASLDESWHRWPEVYLPNYGWIPIDPQGGDKPLPRDQAMNIGNLPNRFLITTQGGGDSEYLGWYYNVNEKYRTEPQVQVHIEAFGEWEPLEND